jgi:hypothetical protein
MFDVFRLGNQVCAILSALQADNIAVFFMKPGEKLDGVAVEIDQALIEKQAFWSGCHVLVI